VPGAALEPRRSWARFTAAIGGRTSEIIVFAGLRIIAVVAAMILSCGFAVAEDAAFSANDLMAGCRAYLVKNIYTEDYFAAKYCAQIIDGIIGAERGI
jgi:hypothetical protein